MIAVAAEVGDPSATRTVYLTVVLLAVLGVLLAGLAIWVLRRTKPEPELLSPLETMDTRGWRKLDPAAQRRLLDEARPPGASPLRREASEPAIDTSFATVAPVASFDDLSENAPTADDLSVPIDDADDRADIDDLDREDRGLDDQDVLDPDVVDPGVVDPADEPAADELAADGQGPAPLDDTEESERIAVPADLEGDSNPEEDAGADAGADADSDDHQLDSTAFADGVSDGRESAGTGAVDGADAPRSIDPLLSSKGRSSDATS